MRRMGIALLSAGVLPLLSLAPSAAADKAGGWTNIKGQVVLAKGAAVPAAAPLQVTADKEMCLKNGPVLSEEWVVNQKNGGIKNVFVWIEPAEAKRGAPFPQNKIHPSLSKPAEKEVVIDQPCCQFIPHALAAREGQDLVIKNSAPKPHNAKWDSINNGQVNPLLPPGAQHVVQGLKPEKAPISLACSIHPWMKAWVRVYDHPYFAVTDADGNFEIKNAPAGKYKLYMWHETGWNGGRAGANGSKTIDDQGGTLDLGQIQFTPAASK